MSSTVQPLAHSPVVWYFDFISPFAYLQWIELQQLQHSGELIATLQPKPILFAGLLKHHGHRGPAEIPEKRRFTYRYLTWLARQRGVAFRLPPAHPFNPLPLLRWALVHADQAGVADSGVVTALFELVWKNGQLPDDAAAMNVLAQKLNQIDWQQAIQQDSVKQRLKSNTEEAIQRGVFGVPTLDSGNELFWGQDSTAMFMDYWRQPQQFEDEEMQRVSALPMAAQRRS